MSKEIVQLSFGGRAVGLTFNPSNDRKVQKIKTLFAEIIDVLNDERNDALCDEVNRMYSIAITELQTAQMWAVKAVTWK